MKIAFIGCGSIAVSHLQAVTKSLPDARLFLTDLDSGRARGLASNWNSSGIYSDLDALLAEVQPDSVHILTPPGTHFELAEKALKAGCHVLLEKPATETVDEFKTLSDLAEKNHKILAVDYSILGMPVVCKAFDAIESGRFGRLISVHCDFACSWPGNTIPYGDPKHWAYSLKGGVLQNMADHPASLILRALEPIAAQNVSWACRHILPNDCPDILHIMVKNRDQVGSFTLSMGHGNSERRAVFLLENGSMMLDLGRQILQTNTGRGPYNFIKKSVSGLNQGCQFISGTFLNIVQVATGKLRRDPGVFRIVHNFYQTIRGEENLLVTRETALRVTQLLEQAWNELPVDGLLPKLESQPQQTGENFELEARA